MYTYDASPAVPGRHVRFGTSGGGTPGFTGSPLKVLNLADAFENEALQISQTEHLSTISYYIETVGLENMCRMTPEEFISNIYEPTWTWMGEKFNVDVFGTVWSSSFGNRFPDLTSVIPFSEAHISIVESNQKRSREIAAETAALVEKRVDSIESTIERQARRKKAKATARKSRLDAAAKRAKIGLSHDSDSGEDEEVRARTNSIDITPDKKRKRKTDDSSLSRSDHFIATQKIGIDAARAESEQCYKDATAHGVGREERAKLLKTAMELGTLCDSLEKQNTPRSSSFGQTDSGFGKVVLSRVPAELKGLMDYKPTLPVTEFFQKLGDSLQSENSSSKVPWLISCLTGKLLQRFREQIELAGGVARADFDKCKSWVEEELLDPDEVTKLHEKFRACKQNAKQSLDDFLKTTNDCRDRLEERGAKPDREAYKHQINTGIRADIMALALQTPEFDLMNLTSKIRVWTASEKSLALIAKSKSAQISVAQAKGIIKQKKKKGNTANLSAIVQSDDEDGSDTVDLADLDGDEINREINRRAQAIVTKQQRKNQAKLAAAAGFTSDGVALSKKQKASINKANLAALQKDWSGKKGKGAKADPRESIAIGGFVNADKHFSAGYAEGTRGHVPDWKKKRAAHDLKVQKGAAKASDAPELYRMDRWQNKFACLLCRKTGHTQDNARCPA
jgi:hypothetical protein